MSDDAESSTEAQRETPDEPEIGAISTIIAPDRDAGRFVIAFVWATRYGVHLAVADSLLLVGLVLVSDVRILRSLQIISLTAGLSMVIAGRWAGGQTVDLMGGPRIMWSVNANLPDRDGADIYTCSTSRWFEWTVVDSRLWWATPNLAFDRGVDLDARGVTGTWVGSLPDPVPAQALEYLWYSHRRSEPKTRGGESLEIGPFAIVRVVTVRAVKHVVQTFEKSTLPGDGNALHAETDSVLKGFDLDDSGFVFDEDPTEWVPDDDDSVPDPLADLDQRREQHAVNGESE